MKFGLTSAEWGMIEKLALEPLRRLGATIYVFGSRARGQHQKFSDLDLLYELPPQSPKPSLHIIGDIKDGLVESNLPIKVDIVDLDELANSYRPSVMKDRVRI
jgi:predicted nucleotidyltransferase